MRKLAVLFLVFATTLGAQTIRVAIDATDAPRKLFNAHLTITAAPGPMRLAYAKWIPGEHGPTGPITDLVNVRMSANGQAVTWQRDPLDVFAFNLVVPNGASSVDIDLSYLAPIANGNFTAGPSSTDDLAVIAWNTLLLFPPGRDAGTVMVEATMRVPEGWAHASALNSDGTTNIAFERASLMTYIDSPVIIGRHLKTVTLQTPPNAPPHRIDIVADSAAALETPPAFAADYSRLVAEAGALYGAYHFRKYDWLLTLSDGVAHFGLEHHESSDDRMEEEVLSKESLRRSLAGLLAHEYSHSWNGKYRRPAGLLSPDYQKPMEGNLLWVYEGLTQYLGTTLATRAGLWDSDYYRENLAAVAAGFDVQPGRTWRPAVRHRRRRAGALRLARCVAQSASRHRLLRRVDPDLARGRFDHPPENEWTGVARRFHSSLSRWRERRSRGQAVHVRRRRRQSECHRAVRLAHASQRAAVVDEPARADGRHHQ